MNGDIRDALISGEIELHAYIKSKLTEALSEKLRNDPEFMAEEDRIINGTGEDGPGISPELRAILNRPGIGTVPRGDIYTRLSDGAMLRPSDVAAIHKMSGIDRLPQSPQTPPDAPESTEQDTDV